MKHQWNCSCVSGTSWFLPNGFFSAGQAARSVESGSLSTPFGAAVSSATPAEPSPRSGSSCVNSPPKEWPMMIGGRSSPRMICS